MVKQRLSTADVAAEVACLRQRIVGLKVANVYDITPKTYVLKLSRSGEEGEKVLLLIESGTRLHTVQAMPPKSDTPSNFSLKLRKHIRGRRLDSVTQLGVDRIAQLTFGTGDNAAHLILEFYAQGNVVLTDSKYEVLTLLRSHRDDAKGFAIMARHPYPIHTIRLRQALAPDSLEAALAGAPQGATLKGLLSELLPYGPLVADHCALAAGLEPGRAPAAAPLGHEERAALLGAVRGWERWLDECETKPPEGFIYVKKGQADGESTYEDFEPARFAQHAGRDALPPFPTFDAALDEFFGKIQGQRAAAASEAREKGVVGKVDAIRRDHERRLQALQAESEQAEVKARLIEYNLVAVDAALDAVREALAGGLDWRDLGRMIKEERRAGNPVASLIDSLQLERNRVTLLLSNWLDEEGGEEEGDDEAATRPATKVEVDLGLSAHANARAYYDSRRKHQTKQAKTLGANEKALKAAEKKAQQQLKQARVAPLAVPARKPYWFERFHWFISSENFLVLSGRDAQQNELLVKRYMRAGDIYVHADLHGASTTVIKNHQPGTPIPPLTLAQAGQACVCRSAAWGAEVVTSAWWVYPEQVSKAAPSGEYLVTGSFMIRGKKNYLPPQPLVMGFGFMFRLEESCVAAHVGERAPRLLEGEEEPGNPGREDSSAAAAHGEEGVQREGEVVVLGFGPGLGHDEDGEEDADGGTSSGSDGEELERDDADACGSSALDAFLDASADRLRQPAQQAQQQQQRPRQGGGGGGLASAFQRYGLSDRLPSSQAAAAEELRDGEDGEQGAAQQAQQAAQQGRRHLSAKERQQLKKGGASRAASEGAEAPAVPPRSAQQAQQRGPQPKQEQQPGKPPQQAQQQGGGVRGKGSKGKKAKQRYGDQDEEDKELAMAVLQSAGQKKDRKDRKTERKQRMAARKAAKSGAPTQEITPEALAALKARPLTEVADPRNDESGSEVDGEAGGEDDAASSSGSSEQAGSGGGVATGQAAGQRGVNSGGKQQSGRPLEQGDSPPAASPAAAAAGPGGQLTDSLEQEEEDDNWGDQEVEEAEEEEEEAAGGGGEGDRGEQAQLDALTGCPRPEDILLFAVPVMASYKFKVKLIPGSLKKGKAVRQVGGWAYDLAAATELLSRAAEASQRERDLLKAAPEQDGINCLVAGLQKIKQGQKKKKK
ncbi:hypothetical protein N2152v2_011100 [Parachlorella kessleri]